MKIVIIGESVKEGWAQTFKRAFESLGHKVSIVDDREIYRASSKWANNRYAHRLGWRFLAGRAQNDFIEAVRKEHPDLILIFKGWLWKPDTFKRLRAILPKVVIFNYNPDSPFNKESHGNANNWIRKSIPLFDSYFIWSKELTEKIKRYGAKRSEYLPCGYDPELHYPVSVTPVDRMAFGSDVVFVGSWDKEREEWVRGLLKYNIKIWGNSWQKAAPDVRAVWSGREVVGEEFSKVCASSKIVLDLLRPQNKSSHNMKTFEIPACKGFMLSERSDEQREFFEEGKEAEYFKDIEELRTKIDHYLDSPEERERIAEAGYKKLLRGPNTYTDRCKQLLEAYEAVEL
jgi:spore maturation protein CgeB